MNHHHPTYSPYALLAVVSAYVMILILAGHWAERRARQGRDITNHGVVYALGLTAYCTSWTFFGSVGSAANGGMTFVTVYLGPTLVMLLAWTLIRRLIRLREKFHFASVVDLFTQRYGQSIRLGAFITLVLLAGMIPYVALQVRSLLATFELMTGLSHSDATISQGHYADEGMIVMIGVMTCLFGLRRVDTRERQYGLMAVLAIEAFVKLLAFLAVGAFVVWGLFDGFGDLFARLNDDPALRQRFVDAPLTADSYLTWMSYLVLSMAAVIFLPRMFHVMVVENHDERHLLTAMWLFPLYLLIMSLFVLPIAAAGLLLGHAPADADWLPIHLPLHAGKTLLAFVAYLGGFSAAVGMVMVACTAMAIMFSNHVVLPLIDRGVLRGALRGGLRPIRWIVVFSLLGLAHLFEQRLGNSYLLIQMGLISFAAVLQFVPTAIGALFWRRGNLNGAWWGLGTGWLVWFYTLMLPAIGRSGIESPGWLTLGPFGVEWLIPEALFGLDLRSPYANAVFWTLLFNALAYVVASLLAEQSENESVSAIGYHDILDPAQHKRRDIDSPSFLIERAVVVGQIEALFGHYLPPDEASHAIERLTLRAPTADAALSGRDYRGLTARVEHALAGSIGAAMARKGVRDFLCLSDVQAAALKDTLSEELAALSISPQQLRDQVDYYRSLRNVDLAHKQELHEKIVALETAARERAQADAARRESETRFRSLAENAPVMIWTVDADGGCYFNRTWRQFVGDADGEDTTIDWTARVHPDDRDSASRLMAQAVGGRQSMERELRLRRVDGEYRVLRLQVVPRWHGDGAYAGVVASAVDISDLAAAELSLRRSKEELEQLVDRRTRDLQAALAETSEREQTIRSITDTAQDAVIMLDERGGVAFWNPSAERIFGWPVNEVRGRELADFLLPERFRADHRAAYRRFQEGRSGAVLGHTVELVALDRAGKEFPVELSLSSAVVHGHRHAIGLLRDVTERKRAAAALEREKAWSEDIIRLAPSLIVGLDTAGNILLFNEAAEALTGYRRQEVLAKNWVQLFVSETDAPEITAIIDEAAQTGDILRYNENPIRARDGTRRIVAWSSQVMKDDERIRMILSFGVDVTERRRAERELRERYAELKSLNRRLEEAQNQLLQSEKMASIGQLAAGIAHEINNPVGFVNSNLGSLKKYCLQLLELVAAYESAPEQARDPATADKIGRLKQALDFEFLQEDLPALIKESEDGLLRVKKIVQDLKDFSHVGQTDWQFADLNAGLDSTLNVVWNEVKYKATVDKQYGDIPEVECLAAQLNQVFMNLIVNAVHALDESKGMGKLILRTGAAGDEVWIEVEDNGKGMSEDVRKRVFEPFFTTKPVGKGTGLGLSLSYNIVQKHHGRIELVSTPGVGSRFRVIVPVHQPPTP